MSEQANYSIGSHDSRSLRSDFYDTDRDYDTDYDYYTAHYNSDHDSDGSHDGESDLIDFARELDVSLLTDHSDSISDLDQEYDKCSNYVPPVELFDYHDSSYVGLTPVSISYLDTEDKPTISAAAGHTTAYQPTKPQPPVETLSLSTENDLLPDLGSPIISNPELDWDDFEGFSDSDYSSQTAASDCTTNPKPLKTDKQILKEIMFDPDLIREQQLTVFPARINDDDFSEWNLTSTEKVRSYIARFHQHLDPAEVELVLAHCHQVEKKFQSQSKGGMAGRVGWMLDIEHGCYRKVKCLLVKPSGNICLLTDGPAGLPACAAACNNCTRAPARALIIPARFNGLHPFYFFSKPGVRTTITPGDGFQEVAPILSRLLKVCRQFHHQSQEYSRHLLTIQNQALFEEALHSASDTESNCSQMSEADSSSIEILQRADIIIDSCSLGNWPAGSDKLNDFELVEALDRRMWNIVVSAAKIRLALRDTGIPQHKFRRMQKELRLIMTNWDKNEFYITSLQNFNTANSSKPSDLLKNVITLLNSKRRVYNQQLTALWEGCRQAAANLELSDNFLLEQTIPFTPPVETASPALAALPPPHSPPPSRTLARTLSIDPAGCGDQGTGEDEPHLGETELQAHNIALPASRSGTPPLIDLLTGAPLPSGEVSQTDIVRDVQPVTTDQASSAAHQAARDIQQSAFLQSGAARPAPAVPASVKPAEPTAVTCPATTLTAHETIDEFVSMSSAPSLTGWEGVSHLPSRRVLVSDAQSGVSSVRSARLRRENQILKEQLADKVDRENTLNDEVKRFSAKARSYQNKYQNTKKQLAASELSHRSSLATVDEIPRPLPAKSTTPPPKGVFQGFLSDMEYIVNEDNNLVSRLCVSDSERRPRDRNPPANLAGPAGGNTTARQRRAAQPGHTIQPGITQPTRRPGEPFVPQPGNRPRGPTNPEHLATRPPQTDPAVDNWLTDNWPPSGNEYTEYETEPTDHFQPPTNNIHHLTNQPWADNRPVSERGFPHLDSAYRQVQFRSNPDLARQPQTVGAARFPAAPGQPGQPSRQTPSHLYDSVFERSTEAATLTAAPPLPHTTRTRHHSAAATLPTAPHLPHTTHTRHQSAADPLPTAPPPYAPRARHQSAHQAGALPRSGADNYPSRPASYSAYMGGAPARPPQYPAEELSHPNYRPPPDLGGGGGGGRRGGGGGGGEEPPGPPAAPCSERDPLTPFYELLNVLHQLRDNRPALHPIETDFKMKTSDEQISKIVDPRELLSSISDTEFHNLTALRYLGREAEVILEAAQVLLVTGCGLSDESALKIVDDAATQVCGLISLISSQFESGRTASKCSILSWEDSVLEVWRESKTDQSNDNKTLTDKFNNFDQGQMALKSALRHRVRKHCGPSIWELMEGILFSFHPDVCQTNPFSLRSLYKDFTRAVANTQTAARALIKCKHITSGDTLNTASMHRIEHYWTDVSNCFSGLGYPNILEFKVKAMSDLDSLKTPSSEQVQMILNWTTAQAHALLKPAVANGSVKTPKQAFELLKEHYGNKFSLMTNLLQRHLSLEAITTRQRYMDRGWDQAQAYSKRDTLYREHQLLIQEASRLLEHERQEQKLAFRSVFHHDPTSEADKELIKARVAVLLSAEYLHTLFMLIPEGDLGGDVPLAERGLDDCPFVYFEAIKNKYDSLVKQCMRRIHMLPAGTARPAPIVTLTAGESALAGRELVSSLPIAGPAAPLPAPTPPDKPPTLEEIKSLITQIVAGKAGGSTPNPQKKATAKTGRKDRWYCVACKIKGLPSYHDSAPERDNCVNFKQACATPSIYEVNCSVCHGTHGKGKHFQVGARIKRFSCPSLIELGCAAAQEFVKQKADLCYSCLRDGRSHFSAGSKMDPNTRTCRRDPDDGCSNLACKIHFSICTAHFADNAEMFREYRTEMNKVGLNLNTSAVITETPLSAFPGHPPPSAAEDQSDTLIEQIRQLEPTLTLLMNSLQLQPDFKLDSESRPLLSREVTDNSPTDKLLDDNRGLMMVSRAQGANNSSFIVCFDSGCTSSILRLQSAGRSFPVTLPRVDRPSSVIGIANRNLISLGAVAQIPLRGARQLCVPGQISNTDIVIPPRDLSRHVELAIREAQCSNIDLRHIAVTNHEGVVDILMGSPLTEFYPEVVFTSETGFKLYHSQLYTTPFNPYLAGGRLPPLAEFEALVSRLEMDVNLSRNFVNTAITHSSEAGFDFCESPEPSVTMENVADFEEGRAIAELVDGSGTETAGPAPPAGPHSIGGCAAVAPPATAQPSAAPPARPSHPPHNGPPGTTGTAHPSRTATPADHTDIDVLRCSPADSPALARLSECLNAASLSETELELLQQTLQANNGSFTFDHKIYLPVPGNKNYVALRIFSDQPAGEFRDWAIDVYEQLSQLSIDQEQKVKLAIKALQGPARQLLNHSITYERYFTLATLFCSLEQQLAERDHDQALLCQYHEDRAAQRVDAALAASAADWDEEGDDKYELYWSDDDEFSESDEDECATAWVSSSEYWAPPRPRQPPNLTDQCEMMGLCVDPTNEL